MGQGHGRWRVKNTGERKQRRTQSVLTSGGLNPMKIYHNYEMNFSGRADKLLVKLTNFIHGKFSYDSVV